MIVAKQMHQRAQKQDEVRQGLRKMTVMLTRYIEDADYGQHDQRNANLALPKRRLSGTGVMGMVHDNSLVSMAAGSV